MPSWGQLSFTKVSLISKSDQHVLDLKFKFVEEKTTGRGDDEETKETVLGSSVLNDAFDIKTGESKTFDFSISYAYDAKLADKGGVLGAVGKLGAFAAKEKLEYYVIAECDVKGTPFDPSDRSKVIMVD